MRPAAFASLEEFALYLQERFGEGDLAAALDAASRAEELFPGDAEALHLAGLARERCFLELQARGEGGYLELYRQAEHCYRRAIELDPGEWAMHAERLYGCLFVLGSQSGLAELLREAREIAGNLASEAGELGSRFRNEVPIVSSAIARVTQDAGDWHAAAHEFDAAPAPEGDREACFYHQYRGIALREIAQRQPSDESFRRAIASLEKASLLQDSRGLCYMLADCLVQLADPTGNEVAAMNRLVGELRDSGATDPLVDSLVKRWELRKKLLGHAE
ncbi:hypothetical protein HZA57_08000 [Candidatus Poribacteria bacterium]|nr:hypothetical protein [Candidatus Poribacteria bacterium]